MTEEKIERPTRQEIQERKINLVKGNRQLNPIFPRTSFSVILRPT